MMFAHVGAEGGERLLDALLVADVGVDGGEDGQAAALVGGDGQAGLGHQAEQADGLEGDGLAAGVGPGDEQDGVRFAALARPRPARWAPRRR